MSGSAFGYFTRVGLFGGPPADRGPAPTVTLPTGGSAVPVTATVPSANASYGPGIIFTSGPITVSTQGTTGATGSVTSSTTIAGTNTSGAEVFTATTVTSRCTGSEAGVSGSTTITNGTLQTDDGDTTTTPPLPPIVVPLPANPPPNTTILGRVRSVGDSFRYVFNEQIVNPDGSLTVNAAHQYLLGPTALGEAIIGQSKCGVTATPTTTTLPATTTTLPATTSTTHLDTTTTRASTTTTTKRCGPDGHENRRGRRHHDHEPCPHEHGPNGEDLPPAQPPHTHGPNGEDIYGSMVASTREMPQWLLVGAGVMLLLGIAVPLRVFRKPTKDTEPKA